MLFGVWYKWVIFFVFLIVVWFFYNMNIVFGFLVNFGCSVSMFLLVLIGVGVELVLLMLILIIAVCCLMLSFVSMVFSVVFIDLM